MSNPIRDILHDMDMEFTSTIPMSDEQIGEVYRKYAKRVKKKIIGEFVKRLKKSARSGGWIDCSDDVVPIIDRSDDVVPIDEIDRISREFLEGE